MEFQRINAYEDARFSKKVLFQHGCFLADDKPYEIEIISDSEAVVRGEDAAIYPQVIEEFRFYTPHITIFYNTERQVIKQYPAVQLLTIPLESIQPSQFYVDESKIAAVRRTSSSKCFPMTEDTSPWMDTHGSTMPQGWAGILSELLLCPQRITFSNLWRRRTTAVSSLQKT